MNPAQIHSELLEQLPDIEDDFLEAHRDVLLAAIGQVPGVDAVRAVVIRHLPRLVSEPLELEAYLQQAAKALRAFPDAVTAGDPVALMARHPAWVGLAHLEVSEALGGDAEDAMTVAIQHARLGFSAASGGAVQDGEVLWAMAETAEDAGWEERATQLLDRAASSPFADPVSQAQVQLLAGQHTAHSNPDRARGLLEGVVNADVPHPLRVQAAYVRSHIAEHDDDLAAARAWVERALELVEDDDDPSVSEHLAGELARLADAP
ncbi:MAG: hypothetical protein R3F61_03155 [Myxococcota bacterium]